MSEMNSDLLVVTENIVREFVLENLPYDRNKTAVLRDLEGMTGNDLLHTYLNWFARIVPSVPRHVHLSQSLLMNPLLSKYGREYGEIRSAIEKGISLQPFLSRSVRYGYDRTKGIAKNLRKRRDLDLMLNDWGIHHLHLSSCVEDDGFVARSDYILFAIFRANHAFLIDIRPHNEEHVWARKELFRAILKSWPDYDLIWRLEGIEAGGENADDDAEFAERHVALRQAGVVSPVVIDGSVYVGSGGLSTAGTSWHSGRWTATIRRDLANFFSRWFNAPGGVRSEVLAQGALLPDEVNFSFFIQNDGKYGALEKERGMFLKLGQIVF
ncbi:hypothetical protein P8T57_14215 [Thalassospira sp. SN3W]|uniref:hypothetical protein n=1 Tax=Thalassospira sp. SN3W TaxID=3035476 RepID=UPI00311B1CBD